jgi:AcrR family transcriptional regulator
MSPRPVAFSRDRIRHAALAVVRRRGLDGLSARAIATALRSSVAPVYQAYGSMGDLTRAVLEDARRRLDERTRRAYTDIPFLNVGVGMVEFARDEHRLFQALFLSRHHQRDILETFRASVLSRMKEDAALQLMPDRSLERVLDRIWLYTLGLATAIVYDQMPDTRTDTIVRSLKDMGNILMFAELAGTADSESPANEAQWARLVHEQGLILPPDSPGACPEPGAKEPA